MNLLVIDWDYFWPVMEPGNPKLDGTWVFYDWTHSEIGALAALYYEAIWPTRAAAFLRAGLPLPTTSGLETTFWSRFNIHRGARLYYANSNVQAFHPRVRRGLAHNGSALWLFDAHHDSGGYRYDLAQTMKRQTLECEDWMVGYNFRGCALHMRYPQWRHYALDGEPKPIVEVDRQVDDEARVETEFHRVFVCKSGAWTPSWGDEQFQRFIQECPVRHRHALDPLGATTRRWDLARAHREAEEIDRAVRRFENERAVNPHE